MKNLNEYCRKNRSCSISPSVSFDNNQNLNDSERVEKEFYSVTVNELTREIFASFDDLIKHVNHYLVKTIRSSVKCEISEQDWDEIFSNFLDATFSRFSSSFDEGEIKANSVLQITNINKDIVDYLTKRDKLRNMEDINPKMDELIDKEFEEEKLKLYNQIRENLKLKIELEMERKISEAKEKDFNKIEEKLKVMGDQLKQTQDLSYIEKNVDMMITKLKGMRRELNQITY